MKNDLLTLENAKERAEDFIEQIPAYPGLYEGTGIVICGGGLKYFTNAWVTIRMLRRLGCVLPIQIWHLGSGEVEERMRAITGPYNVEFVDAHEVRKTHPVRSLSGWELKPFSILYSRFKQVLLLDAHNVPVVNPEFLFKTPQFQQMGAIFWPDFGHLKPFAPIWDICGIPYRDEPEWESGQIVVDKEKCWRALRLAMWYNEYSDFYYQYILGDKDTYHLAFRKLEQTVSMPSTPVRALKLTLCQHDFDGNRIFQHRVGDKWSLEKENDHIWGFQHDAECHAFLEELQVLWFGKKQRTPKFESVNCSQKVNEFAREIIENIYQYERVGFDSRPMTFASDGRVDRGRGLSETYWDLKEELGKMVLLLSSKTELTCELTRQDGGVWEGRWLRFERMPITLKPVRSIDSQLQLNKKRKNSRPDRRRVHIRLSTNYKEPFQDWVRYVAPILAAKGIDLRPLSREQTTRSARSSRKIKKKMSPGEWNLLFCAPKENIAVKKRTIWVTSWDFLRLPAGLVNSLNKATGIIVPSEWNASCFSCAGVRKPIWVVPPGIDRNLFRYTPMNMNGPCVFGMVYTNNSPEIESRAARIAELFLKAFPDQKDVALKIYSETDLILPFTDSRMEITRHSPADKSLASWLRKLTCFISLERPQGWLVLEHKALATGRPLIGARFGGITEFFSDTVGYPVEFSTTSGGKYHQDTNQGQPNPEHIIELMQQVHRDRVQARQLGINGVEIVSKFTWKYFCKQFLQMLELLESQ